MARGLSSDKNALLPTVVAIVIAGIVAAAYTFVFYSGDKILIFVLFGGAIAGISAMLLGNARLAVLFGLILVAPLSIGKDFAPFPHMGGASAYSIEVADVFLGALVAFQLRDLLRQERPFVVPAGSAGLLVMIAVGMLHVVFGPNFVLSSQQVFQMIKDFVLFFVVVNELVRVRQFRMVFWALMATLAFQAGVGIVQYFNNGVLGLEFLGELDAETLELTNLATFGEAGAVFRIGGLVGHPNLLGAFIALLLPIGVASFSYRMKPWPRLAVIGICALAAAALLLTLSRSSWLSSALGLFILMVFSVANPRWRTRGVPIALMVAIGGLFVMVPALPIIVQRFVESDSGAVDFRIEWMGVAWEMVVNNPVTGIGLNTFVFQLPNNNPYGGAEDLTQRFGETWPVVHNIYLLVWSELGTIGFVAFIYTMFRLLQVAFDNLRYVMDPVVYAMSIGAAGGLGAIMLDGMASFFLRNAQCGRMFWIVAAILVACRYWNLRNAPLRSGRRVEEDPADPRAAIERV